MLCVIFRLQKSLQLIGRLVSKEIKRRAKCITYIILVIGQAGFCHTWTLWECVGKEDKSMTTHTYKLAFLKIQKEMSESRYITLFFFLILYKYCFMHTNGYNRNYTFTCFIPQAKRMSADKTEFVELMEGNLFQTTYFSNWVPKGGARLFKSIPKGR